MSSLPRIAPSLNCRGQLLSLATPRIMGILNLTPDSFSDGGRHNQPSAALLHTEKMLREGADIIDIGGYSSRPHATNISAAEEITRVIPVIELILQTFPDTLISIDTFRAQVAQAAMDAGARIVNDISGGILDAKMLQTVAAAGAPFVLMHMRGTPQTMQQHTDYAHLVEDIWAYFVARINAAHAAGIRDIILDLGFGFAKTMEQNYELMAHLSRFAALEKPLLVGISRKSMLYRKFNTTPDDVIDAAAALHLHALQCGARLLRVHDVASAARIREIFVSMQAYGTL